MIFDNIFQITSWVLDTKIELTSSPVQPNATKNLDLEVFNDAEQDENIRSKI